MGGIVKQAMKPRNPELEDSLRKAVGEVDRLMRESIPNVPHDRKIRYVRRGPDSPPTREEALQIRLGQVVVFLWDEIRSLPNFARARDVLLRPKTLELLKATTLYRHSVESGRDWAPIVEWYVVKDFVDFVLRHGAHRFDSVYRYFEEYMYSEKVGVSEIAQLRNFECEVDVIELEDDLRIRRLASAEIQDIASLAQMSMPAYWPLQDLWRHEYGVETSVTLEKQSLLLDAPRYPYKPERVLIALRLFKSGAVFYNTVVGYHHEWKYKVGVREHTTGGTWQKAISHKQVYVLNKDEIGSFVDLWKTIKDADIQRVSVALERLESGLAQEDPKYRLIDFVIGFENLFGEGEGELCYRMGMRLAWFLANKHEDCDSRDEIYRQFRTAYDLRSRIVHGAESFKGKLKRYNNRRELVALLDVIEDYLRASIRHFLVDGPPEDWEEIVLGKSKQPSPTSSAAG